MRNYIYLALFTAPLLFLSGQCKAQLADIGGTFGTASYSGDVSGEVIHVNQIGASGGLYFRYHAFKKFALRTGIGAGKIMAADANSSNPEIRERNLSFSSVVTDFYFVGEYFPLGSNTERRTRRFSPYIFAGLGFFHFNPKAEYKGETYALQPLGTEGQGLPEYPTRPKYRLNQMSYPFGAGVRYNLNREWNLGLEMRINKTFTDFIDDVSGTYANVNYIRERNGEVAAALADRSVEITGDPNNRVEGEMRGNPKINDWYFFTGVTLSYIPRRFTCFKF